MDILYIILIVLLGWIEISKRFSTRNLLKKFSIGMMIVGALVSLKQPNHIIEYGLILFFLAEYLTAYFHRKNRRKSDSVTNCIN